MLEDEGATCNAALHHPRNLTIRRHALAYLTPLAAAKRYIRGVSQSDISLAGTGTDQHDLFGASPITTSVPHTSRALLVMAQPAENGGGLQGQGKTDRVLEQMGAAPPHSGKPCQHVNASQRVRPPCPSMRAI